MTAPSSQSLWPSRPISRVVIVGLGLIGGSLARDFARAPGVEVVGWDADATTRAQALAAGIPVTQSLAECVAGEPDLVVLAVPLTAMRVVCDEIAPLLSGDTWVTDVGSVKKRVRESVVASGLAKRYVGSHPMAGTEASGFEASSSGMFHDAAWALTVAAPPAGVTAPSSTAGREPAALSSKDDGAHPVAEQQAVLAITDVLTRVLGVQVYVLTDDQHDEAVALISHLPHVLAAELLGQAALSPVRDVALALAAGSFRDGTRVAGTNPARTEAMVTGNAAWVAPLVNQAAVRLQVLAEQLRAGGDVGAFFSPEASVPDASAPKVSIPDVPSSDVPVSNTASADTVAAAALAWPELRSLLLAAAARGRAIRAVNLGTHTLTLAPQIS